MDEAVYYKHSGRIGVASPIYISIFGLAAVLVIGVIYGFIISKMPFVYFNFILVVIFAVAVGSIVGKCAVTGKVRNYWFPFVFGIAFALFGQYISWIVWLQAYGDFSEVALSPIILFSQIGNVAEQGAWTLLDWKPSEAAYYTVWVLEIIVICCIACYVAMDSLRMPFCEECNSWVNGEVVITPLSNISNPSEVISQIDINDFSCLQELKRLDLFQDRYTEIVVQHCHNCDGIYLMDINTVYLRLEAGRESLANQPLVQNVHIDRRIYERIINI